MYPWVNFWGDLRNGRAESAPPGWNRVKASENLGATAVALVAPAVTSLNYIILFSALCVVCTGKSLSEALLFAEHGENMLCTKIVLNVGNKICTQHVFPGLSLEFSFIELVIQ